MSVMNCQCVVGSVNDVSLCENVTVIDPNRSSTAIPADGITTIIKLTHPQRVFSWQKAVMPKTLKMGVICACMVLMMKWGPRNITGRPGVSIM